MSLETTKRRLSRKYLGKGGIHGLGLSHTTNALRVHVELSATAKEKAEQSAILEELKRDAAPYDVLLTIEEMPRARG